MPRSSIPKGVEVIRQPLFFADVLRQDVEKEFPNQKAILSNMPAEEDGYLSIPKVGEEEVHGNQHSTSTEFSHLRYQRFSIFFPIDN